MLSGSERLHAKKGSSNLATTASSSSSVSLQHTELEVSPRELKGFYAFAFAMEGYSALAVSSYFPIILEGLAASVAVTTANHALKCDPSIKGYDCSVALGGGWVPTTALVFYATTISVLVQFVLFVSVSSLADYGDKRKQFLMFFGYATCALGLLILLVVHDSMWWLAYLIYMASNVTFGASFVFYYALVPIITRNSRDVMAAQRSYRQGDISDVDYARESDRVANDISSKGFAWGYVAAVGQLVVGLGIALALGDTSRFGLTMYYGLQIGVAMASVWGAGVLYFCVSPWTPSRPGPPLPVGEHWLMYSYKRLFHTLRQAKRLPQLFKFLAAWFVYSDGFSTIVSVAVLYAQTQLGASTMLLLVATVVTPLAAGNIIVRKLGLTTRQLLIVHTLLYTLLPVYGLIFFRSTVEIIPLAAYHGFLLGATQSSCRVQFSELLPPGHESEFFGLYEVTDKGSAWIGPLVIDTGAIRDGTGSLKNGFYFLILFLLIPAGFFYWLDEVKGKQDAMSFSTDNTDTSIELRPVKLTGSGEL